MKKNLLKICAMFSFFVNFSEIVDAVESRNWESYYQNTANINTPHKTLLIAQKSFQSENKLTGTAVDLGAGTGRDTVFLLQQGWSVLAVDAQQLSIAIILSRIDPLFLPKLDVMEKPFSEMVLPDNLDLINASYSLPFCNPQEFPQCWEIITEQLSIGGRFSGQFFGEKDEWASNPNLTIHSYERMIDLFKDRFIIEYLQIEDGPAPCGNGKIKHWHVYHIVAKKIR